MGPRPWGGALDPGPYGETLGWDPGEGPWDGAMGWNPRVGQQRLFFNILSYTPFSLSELQEFQTYV